MQDNLCHRSLYSCVEGNNYGVQSEQTHRVFNAIMLGFETLHGRILSKRVLQKHRVNIYFEYSVGSEKNRWLTTQRFDQYALIVFRRKRLRCHNSILLSKDR